MIGANYLVADGCQATARDEANVTATDDGDAQKYTPMDRFKALAGGIIPIRRSFEQIVFEKQYAGIKLEVQICFLAKAVAFVFSHEVPDGRTLCF
jgi:hypothetical protein